MALCVAWRCRNEKERNRQERNRRYPSRFSLSSMAGRIKSDYTTSL
jgi:hypothetical protein